MVIDKIENSNSGINNYEKIKDIINFKTTNRVLSGVEKQQNEVDDGEWTLQFLWYSEDNKYKEYSFILDQDYNANDIKYMMLQLWLANTSNAIEVLEQDWAIYQDGDFIKKWEKVQIRVLSPAIISFEWEFYTSSVWEDPDRKEDREKWYTLSEKDFKNYFEWDDFQQRNVGNCRLLSWIDSITHLGNYKELIMKSVKRIENWFIFMIPLWCKSETSKYYQVNDDFDNQLDIVWWDMKFLESKKKWLKAFGILCGQVLAWKENFDVSIFEAWEFVLSLYTKLFEWVHVYGEVFSSKNADKDRERVWETLDYIMENFDEKKSLLTIGVHALQSWLFDFKDVSEWESGNHMISIERTYKDNYWTLKVVVSNPWDSSQSKIISWSELREKCFGYSFWTFDSSIWIDSAINSKNIKKLEKTGGNRDESRNKDMKTKYPYDKSSDKSESPDKKISLDWVIQIEWKCNEELRKERGTVTVNATKRDKYGRPIELKVKSWWKDADIIESKDKYIVKIQWKKLEINKSDLSSEFNWDKNDLYKMYLYAPKISVFISRMLHDYIDDKKWDILSWHPFVVKDGKLEFDDDPSKFSGTEKWKRRAAKLVWDDTITVLSDWSKLWISDLGLKQGIADFLNSLCV